MPSDPLQGDDIAAPVIPNGEELYDYLMQQIEPELTSSQVHTLREKYKDESAQEKKQRSKRYKAAFATYDEVYKKYMEDLHDQVVAYKRNTMKSLEGKDREREEESMEQLEDLIQNA